METTKAVPYQLAHDPMTYGDKAGWWLAVSTDGESDLSKPVATLEECEVICATLNAQTPSDAAKASAIDLMGAFAAKHAPRVEPANGEFFAELLAMLEAFNSASSMYTQERITSIMDSLNPGKVSGTHTAAGNESILG